MAGSDWQTVEQLQANGIILVEDGNHGENRPRRDEFGTQGTAFVRAADMNGGTIDFKKCEHINEIAIARIRKGIGRPGDILLSHKGTVGKLAEVPAEAPRFVCSPQTTFWRVLNEDVLQRAYLFAYMRTQAFSSQLMSVQGETDMAPYVSLTAQRRLKIPVPMISEQVAIGTILTSLDNKIRQNRVIAATLEELTVSLFKSWFIDFDPIRQEKNSEGLLSAELLRLFPKTLTDAGYPKGWATRKLGSDLTQMITRGIAPVYDTEGILILNQRCVRNLRVDLQKARRHNISRKRFGGERFLQPGDVLINSTGVGTLGRVAQVRSVPEQMTVDSHVTIVRPSDIGATKNFIGVALSALQSHIETLGHGSTGQTELSRESVASLDITVPDKPLLKAFDALTVPLRDRADAAMRQAKVLEGLRDLILPKLISGALKPIDVQNRILAA